MSLSHAFLLKLWNTDNQGVKFCSNCGNRIAPSQGTPAPPPPNYSRPQTGDPVIAAISGLKQGMLGRKNHVLLITNQRLVITELKGKDIKELNKESREQSKAKGEGFFGRLASGVKATMKPGEFFVGKDVNDVIMRYPHTIQIPVGTVAKLSVRNHGMDRNYYDLDINASGFNDSYRFDDYVKRDHTTLKAILGNRYNSTTHFF